MRRKNTKFIDPRYFMDEKMETLEEGFLGAMFGGPHGRAMMVLDPEVEEIKSGRHSPDKLGLRSVDSTNPEHRVSTDNIFKEVAAGLVPHAIMAVLVQLDQGRDVGGIAKLAQAPKMEKNYISAQYELKRLVHNSRGRTKLDPALLQPWIGSEIEK